jgi:hypothetical protein
MWQPPTDPGAGGPGPGLWSPPPGAWWPQPPPRPRRSRGVVVGIVVACVLGVALLVGGILIAVAAGRAVGQDMAAQASVASGQDAASATSPPSVPTSEPVDPSGLGTDAGLNSYAARCYAGDMQACDDLYDLADPMSRYEQYAMTCGGRVKPFDVEYCTDLD